MNHLALIREQITRYGPRGLSLPQTFALLIGGRYATERANRMLAEQSVIGWLNSGRLELEQYLSVAEAARLLSAFHLVKLILADCQPAQIVCPLDAYRWFLPHLYDKEQEELWILCVDAKNHPIIGEMIYRGNASSSIIRVGEIMRPAVRLGAPCLFLAHNHPSGDATPSPEDIHLTREIREAARLLGLDLLDHLIIGSCTDNWTSLKEKGLAFD